MNSPTNPTEQDLNTRLAHEADQFHRRGGTELDLGQVLARAGEIRRGRRMRATMLMAACVLAIAVPTALVAIDRDRTTEQVTPTHPVQADGAPLTLGDLKTGGTPRHGYSQDGTWQLPVAANGLNSLKGRLASAAALQGGVMVAMATEDGDRTAHFIYDQGGTLEQSWPMTGDFAVSADHNVAAFVEPNGMVVAVQDGGSRSFELGKIPHGSGFTAIAVQGENCSGRSEEAGCKVYVATKGEHPQTYVLQPHDIVGTALDPVLDRTVDVSSDRYAGYTSVSDDGSCSAVRDGKLTALWKTCDRRLLSFSPDGKHLLATAAYGSGMGDGELAVLDSDSGKVVLDLKTADEGVITQMVWEDDAHVLAVVYEQGRWAVLRIGLDGAREYAVEPVDAADDVESPFVLPTL